MSDKPIIEPEVHDASYVRESQAERACDLLRSEVLASLPVRPVVIPKLVG